MPIRIINTKGPHNGLPDDMRRIIYLGNSITGLAPPKKSHHNLPSGPVRAGFDLDKDVIEDWVRLGTIIYVWD